MRVYVPCEILTPVWAGVLASFGFWPVFVQTGSQPISEGSNFQESEPPPIHLSACLVHMAPAATKTWSQASLPLHYTCVEKLEA